MAFAAAGLRCIVQGIGSAPSMWQYQTTDAHTDVDADDYFTAGISSYGMKLYDTVIVVDTDTATSTLHHVRATVTAGAASINTATLS